ncbi:MAG: hypothetical protein LBD12_04375, partial [Clostridiales Family XIII bacterium]|nr:hypothetical protein [Clostridiales Family XIII bacterium]
RSADTSIGQGQERSFVEAVAEDHCSVVGEEYSSGKVPELRRNGWGILALGYGILLEWKTSTGTLDI